MVLLTYAKRVLPFLPWVLLGLASLLVIHSLMGFWHTLSLLPNDHQTMSAGSAPRASQTIELGSIFGKAPSLLKVAEGGLILRGIFSTAPEAGSAIIASQGRPAKLYIVGDRLPNGATLIAVHEQQVVLEKAGEQSMLSLPATRL